MTQDDRFTGGALAWLTPGEARRSLRGPSTSRNAESDSVLDSASLGSASQPEHILASMQHERRWVVGKRSELTTMLDGATSSLRRTAGTASSPRMRGQVRVELHRCSPMPSR